MNKRKTIIIIIGLNKRFFGFKFGFRKTNDVFLHLGSKKIIHNNKYLYIFIFKKSNKIMFKIKQKLLSLFREKKKQYHHEILFLKLNYNNFVQEKFYLNICLGCFICLQLKN